MVAGPQEYSLHVGAGSGPERGKEHRVARDVGAFALMLTGLGLALTKRIVEAQSETVTALVRRDAGRLGRERNLQLVDVRARDRAVGRGRLRGREGDA